MVHKEKKKKLRIRRLFKSDQPQEKKTDILATLSSMKKLVTTREQETVLEKIEHETIPSVRDAWIEYFFKITKQTQCNND